MSILSTLTTLRQAYGPSMTDDQCVALINDAAYLHRDEGFGLSRKEAGQNGRRSDGQLCCHDVLMLQNGTYWDVLEGAGPKGVSRPKWGNNGDGVASGKITDPARGWLAPIPPSIPGTDPVEPPAPPDSVVIEVLRSLITEIIQAKLSEAETRLGERLKWMETQHLRLLELAEQQEIRREALALHLDEVLRAEFSAPRQLAGRLTLRGELTGLLNPKK